ncbi:MAG: hypothetical protein J5379_00350 [Clostridiales bacterium]|nr:hypothetical protein [Clostridiales bacterium]
MKNDSLRRFVATAVCLAMVFGSVPAYIRADNDGPEEEPVVEPIVETTAEEQIVEETAAEEPDSVEEPVAVETEVVETEVVEPVAVEPEAEDVISEPEAEPIELPETIEDVQTPAVEVSEEALGESSSDVESITCNSTLHVIENINGMWDKNEEDEWEFRYYVASGVYGQYTWLIDDPDMVFTIKYKDGSQISGTTKEIYESTGTALSFSVKNYVNGVPWVTGESYEITVSYKGAKGTVDVVVDESPVESVTVAADLHITENTNGYFYTASPDDCYYYYYTACKRWSDDIVYYELGPAPEMVFTIKYKDDRPDTVGTAKQIIDNTGIGLEFIDWENQYTEHWHAGNRYEIGVSYLGCVGSVGFVIDESPIESITSNGNISVVENTNGIWVNDLGEPFYMYYIYTEYSLTDNHFYAFSADPDMVFTIKFKDGSADLVGTAEEISASSGEALLIECLDNQYNRHWQAGETHEIRISYMGAIGTVQYSIVQNPIASVTSNHDLQLIVNHNGIWSTNDNNERLYKYTLTSSKKASDGKWVPYLVDDPDMIFTIKYNDDRPDVVGTTEEIYLATGEFFSFGAYEVGYGSQWEAGKTYELPMTYMGYEGAVTVKVVESPIESISCQDQFQIAEGTNGIWTTNNGQRFFEYRIWQDEWSDGVKYTRFLVDPDALFTVKYKDESPDLVGTAAEIFEQTGVLLEFSYLDDQFTTQWVAGNTYQIEVSYLGCSKTIDITIEPDLIESFEIEGPIHIDVTALTYMNFGQWIQRSNGEWFFEYKVPNPNFTVTYKDGTVVTASGSFDLYSATGYWATLDYNQYENHWYPGNTYRIDCLFLGKVYPLDIVIEESPINDVVIAPTSFTIQAGTHCYTRTSTIWDETTHSQKEVTWNYYAPELIFEGTRCTIYGDGFTESYAHVHFEDDTPRGIFYDPYSDQSYSNQWGIGEHAFYLYYKGYTLVIPVTIVEEDPVPMAISDFNVSPKSGVTMTLSWGAYAGAASYDVWYCMEGNRFAVAKSTGPSQTSCSHTGLWAGKQYTYYIVANDSAGNPIAKSEMKSVVALATPTLNTAAMAAGGIALDWSKASGADRYNIYRSATKTGKYEYVTSVQGTEEYTDTTVESGKSYYYKVRAYKKIDGVVYYGGYSDSAGTNYAEVPNLNAVPKSGVTMTLSWGAVSGVYSYEVWASEDGEEFTLAKTTGAKQTSCSHTGLHAGMRYFYYIVAKNSSGKILAISATASAVALATPILNEAELTMDGISLTWSKASGADRYNIYRSTTENGKYDYIESVQKVEYYMDSSAEAGKTYYYKVRAYKKVDGKVYYGGYSNAVSKTYATVSNLSVAPKSGVTMTLSWGAVSGIYSYEVWYAADGDDFLLAKTVGKNQTSCSHTGLRAGKRYSYYILAKDIEGNTIAVSEVKMAVALATPTLDSATGTSTGVKLSWSKASGADRYNIYRSTSENGTYEYIASVQGAEAYVDTTAASGTTYYYKVRAYKKVDGKTYYSGYSSAISGKKG